jgi:integrase/recombinase XerD
MRSVQHMVAALGASAGIAKRLSPHVLRHSAATLALTMGTDISTVGELLRHSDLNVTRR